jgi:hypothetical protein
VTFQRVVLFAELAGIEQDPQQLGIAAGCPLRRNEQNRKHSDPAKKAAEQVKNRPAKHQRREK